MTPFGSRTKKRRAPRLIGQRIDDVVTAAHGFGVHRIDVGDFDRQLRLYRRGGVAGHHGDLCGGVRRRDQADDPIRVHRHLEAEELDVELAALVRTLRRDDGDDPSDAHAHIFPGRCVDPAMTRR